MEKRILTPQEFEVFAAHRQPEVFLSKRFSVKEAAAKALGTGIGRGVSWQHMEVGHSEWGAPILAFSQGALERFQSLGGQSIHVSISDEIHYAVATVIIER